MKEKTVYTWHVFYCVKDQNRNNSSDGGPYTFKQNAENSMIHAKQQISDDGHQIYDYCIREHDAPIDQQTNEDVSPERYSIKK